MTKLFLVGGCFCSGHAGVGASWVCGGIRPDQAPQTKGTVTKWEVTIRTPGSTST